MAPGIAEMRDVALAAVPAAIELRRDPVPRSASPVPADPAVVLEVLVVGLAAIDARVMLAIGEKGHGEHAAILFEYLREVWNYKTTDLDELFKRLEGAILPEAAEPVPRRSALALRDALDPIAPKVATSLGTLAAVAAPADARRLEAARARLERYLARAPSAAEMERVLSVAQRLLAGRKSPAGPIPIDPQKVAEGRAQAEAGRGRPVEEALRDLCRQAPPAR